MMVEKPFWLEPTVLAGRARIAFARGDDGLADELRARAVARAREARDLQVLCPALATAARMAEAEGGAGAAALAAEVVTRYANREDEGAVLGEEWLKEVWYVLARHDDEETVRAIHRSHPETPWNEALGALL